MTVMSDTEIREALDTGELEITPSARDVRAATVDLALGEQAFLAGQDEITRLAQGKLLVLAAGAFALVTVREKLRLGPQIAGRFGLKSIVCASRYRHIVRTPDRPRMAWSAAHCTGQPCTNRGDNRLWRAVLLG